MITTSYPTTEGEIFDELASLLPKYNELSVEVKTYRGPVIEMVQRRAEHEACSERIISLVQSIVELRLNDHRLD